MSTPGQDKAVSLPRVTYQSHVRQHQAAEKPRERRRSGRTSKDPSWAKIHNGFQALGR
jgi:hypothetical protein